MADQPEWIHEVGVRVGIRLPCPASPQGLNRGPRVTVSVLVPYRGDGGPRDAAWAYVQAWWSREHPDFQVLTGACPDGPWCKALAVADALTRADGDTLVVADADVLADGVGAAVAAVQAGAGWAVPHNRVHRLTAEATAALLAGGALPDPPTQTTGGGQRRPNQRARPTRLRGPVHESYTGVAGGGMVVLSRETYQRVPLDPRFLGWGNEDTAAGSAWLVLCGPPWRGVDPLWHLHHPPQPRMSRTLGSPEGLALRRRYAAAAKEGPAAMRALLAEFVGASR